MVKEKVLIIILSMLSPTWGYAIWKKRKMTSSELSYALILRNYAYAGISLVALLIIGYAVFEYSARESWVYFLLVGFVYILTWSRCNEILISFIVDAIEKTGNKKSSSELSYSERIRLSLVSYLELILNFSLIYLVMPSGWFKDDQLKTIIDAIYFSGVTITTLGYGDISPIHWLPKLLVIQEVLAGFSLLIVSFAIYAGRGVGNNNAQ